MADAWDDLGQAYERGGADDGASLPPAERDLYLIMSFILEFEMGGMSGWLYNWATQLKKFDEAAAAMRRRQLESLASIVEEAGLLLTPIESIERDLAAKGQNITWKVMLRLIDPDDKASALSARIDALPDYGLPTRW